MSIIRTDDGHGVIREWDSTTWTYVKTTYQTAFRTEATNAIRDLIDNYRVDMNDDDRRLAMALWDALYPDALDGDGVSAIMNRALRDTHGRHHRHSV